MGGEVAVGWVLAWAASLVIVGTWTYVVFYSDPQDFPAYERPLPGAVATLPRLGGFNATLAVEGQKIQNRKNSLENMAFVNK